MLKARINDWLWIGEHKSCPDDGYELVVHIFRTDQGKDQQTTCIHPDTRHNLKMNYQDGDIIDPSNLKNLFAIVDMLKERKRPTLVHCHAGKCRSPTVGVFLLVFVDGMHPFDALGMVGKAIYDQREDGVCNVPHTPMKQICRLWEERKKSA